MKQLIQIKVSWKHIEEFKNPKTKEITYHVRFPTITYGTSEIKGKTKWSKQQWINLALDDFEKIRGFRPQNIKDKYVEKKYS